MSVNDDDVFLRSQEHRLIGTLLDDAHHDEIRLNTNRDRSHSSVDPRTVGGDTWSEPPPPYSVIESITWNAAPGGQTHQYNCAKAPYHVSNETRHHSFAQEMQQSPMYNYYPSIFTERHPMQAWSQQPSDSQTPNSFYRQAQHQHQCLQQSMSAGLFMQSMQPKSKLTTAQPSSYQRMEPSYHAQYMTNTSSSHGNTSLSSQLNDIPQALPVHIKGVSVPVAKVNPMTPSYADVAHKRPTKAPVVGVVAPQTTGRKQSLRESIDAISPAPQQTPVRGSTAPLDTQPMQTLWKKTGSSGDVRRADDVLPAAENAPEHDFQKIAQKKKKRKKTLTPSNNSANTTFKAQLVHEPDEMSAGGRFQPLVEAAKMTSRSNKGIDELDEAQDNACHERAGPKTKKISNAPKMKDQSTSTSKRGGAAMSMRGGRKQQRQNALAMAVVYYLGLIVMTAWKALYEAFMFLYGLLSEICIGSYEMGVYGLRQCAQKTSRYCTESCYALISWCRGFFAPSSPRRQRIDERSWRTTIWEFLTFTWLRKELSAQQDEDDLGLPSNIDLPRTGDEAIIRLTECAGRDAYAILGLRYDCTDDEIKSYYKRQAVLVHPDKNTSPGAEEAFKILGAAFTLVETPEARAQYNAENMHRRADQRKWRELIENLRERIQEAFNTMGCDCGQRHKRYLVEERSVLEARYCSKCGERHMAREGDIWAESRYCGFLWYYYCLINGMVYDITEWAACERNNLNHIRANSHQVMYRLSSQEKASGKRSRDADELLRKMTDAYGLGNEFQNLFAGNGRARASASTASYQPPERSDSRPRRAGRRRKK